MLLDCFFHLSYEGRFLFLFLMGVLAGAFVNWFVDRFAWDRKYRSPWSRFPKETDRILQCHWYDYCPIIGWFTMQRFSSVLFPPSSESISSKRKKRTSNQKKQKESPSQVPAIPGFDHRFFWFRPLLVELGLGIWAIFLFYWEVEQNGMSLKTMNFLVEKVMVTCPVLSISDLTCSFFIHFFLGILMITASLIDLDDYIIPDILTIPGTILGLVLLTLFPKAVYAPIYWFYGLPQGVLVSDPFIYLKMLFPSSYNIGLWCLPIIVMLCCWAFWCFAILDRRWYYRLGFRRAFLLFVRTLYRSPITRISFILFLLGTVGIIIISQYGPEMGYGPETGINGRTALLNALLGMVFGMVLTWMVRIIGYIMLGRESLGFGDVILMGMLGVYLGWHGALVLFFLAPFAGVVFGVFRLITRMEREIPYGPFLCLAGLAWLLARNYFWNLYEPLFCEPFLIGIMFPICFLLLALLLGIWRLIKMKCNL